MKVEILYFSGCPNWQKAADRTGTALAELGRVDVAIHLEDVNLMPLLPSGWAGSPTVLVDGRDPFVADGDAPELGRDTCRIYRTNLGLEGAPSVEQLRTALSIALDAHQNPEERPA